MQKSCDQEGEVWEIDSGYIVMILSWNKVYRFTYDCLVLHSFTGDLDGCVNPWVWDIFTGAHEGVKRLA